MHIGSKPNQMVYRSKQGGDVFLVVDVTEATLYLYKTVDTVLYPKIQDWRDAKDKVTFWADDTQMMYVLSEISSRTYDEIQDGYSAEDILWELESALEKV